MTQITPDHLSRRGVVYVRQSSPEQVRRNVESRRWQSGPDTEGETAWLAGCPDHRRGPRAKRGWHRSEERLR